MCLCWDIALSPDRSVPFVKILLINQTFYPDPAATAQQLTDFSEDLVRKGHDVTVLTCRRGYADPSVLYAKSEKREGIHIERVWRFSFGRKSKVGRTLDALLINFAFAWKLFWFSRFDVIVALTSPPLVGWVAAIFAKLRRSRLVYWMMDINPDEAILAGWLAIDSIAVRVLDASLKFVLLNSETIVVLDKFMKDRIVAKEVNPNRVQVIPPWSHDENWDTVEREKNLFRVENGLTKKFVVMYSGNHSVCHPLDTLLEAALLLKEDTNVIFVFIGGGERVRDVLDFKTRHKLQNILQLPYQKRSDLKYSLSAADLHIVVMGEPFVGVVHPCKIYGILSIGKPFIYIGPEKSHIGDLIQSGGAGFRVAHGQGTQLASLIQEIQKKSPTWVEEIRNQEQTLAIQYSRKHLGSAMVSLVSIK